MINTAKKTSAAIAGALCLQMWLGAPAIAEQHAEEASAEEAQKTEPLVQRIAATVLGVDDLDAAVAFYSDALGLKVVRTSTTDTYSEAILSTGDAAGTKIVLYQSLTDDAEEAPSGRVVFYTSDAASIVEAFRSAGLDVVREATPVSETSAVRIGIVKDANGHTLEFIQAG
ncbi:VOC family protein [Henriciella litoralis]|uniref:VOC family protein n=1 Tax=Henriciella litoralis TaxID=568102 RepID=UPI0009FD306E|nr:VOC family protein [Henriciella litoralis]